MMHNRSFYPCFIHALTAFTMLYNIDVENVEIKIYKR